MLVEFRQELTMFLRGVLEDKIFSVPLGWSIIAHTEKKTCDRLGAQTDSGFVLAQDNQRSCHEAKLSARQGIGSLVRIQWPLGCRRSCNFTLPYILSQVSQRFLAEACVWMGEEEEGETELHRTWSFCVFRSVVSCALGWMVWRDCH